MKGLSKVCSSRVLPRRHSFVQRQVFTEVKLEDNRTVSTLQTSKGLEVRWNYRWNPITHRFTADQRTLPEVIWAACEWLLYNNWTPENDFTLSQGWRWSSKCNCCLVILTQTELTRTSFRLLPRWATCKSLFGSNVWKLPLLWNTYFAGVTNWREIWTHPS